MACLNCLTKSQSSTRATASSKYILMSGTAKSALLQLKYAAIEQWPMLSNDRRKAICCVSLRCDYEG
eukprot:6214454-Pleurochrysis_carterae.AAC.2